MTKEALSAISKHVVFRETFNDEQTVIKNGGTIAGNSTFNNGQIDLDGTGDYITYPISGKLNTASISFRMVFTPDFDYDADFPSFFFDSSTDNRYLLFKNNNSKNNTLDLYLGDTNIASVAEATYSPYWKVNEKNEIIISGTTGDTSMWLNGNKILEADNTAWSEKNPSVLYVGIDKFIVNGYDGKFNLFEIYNIKLTDEDVAAISSNYIYNDTNIGLIGEWKLRRENQQWSGNLVEEAQAGAGSFDTDQTSWWIKTRGTLTWNESTTDATFLANDTGSCYIYKDFGTVGKFYRFTFKLKSDDTVGTPVALGLGSDVDYIKRPSVTSSYQEYEWTGTATSVNIGILLGTDNGEAVTIDDISIQELEIVDLSGNNNGVLIGKTYTKDNLGRVDYALDFDGTSDSIIVATSPYYSASATSMSFSTWVYTDPADWDTNLDVLVDSASGNPNSHDGFFVGLEDRTSNPEKCIKMAISTVTGGYNQTVSSANAIPNAGWYHIVTSYASGTSKIYVNGVDVTGTTTVSGSGNFTPRNSQVNFGEIQGIGLRLKGKMQDVRMYNRALSQLEIESSYFKYNRNNIK